MKQITAGMRGQEAAGIILENDNEANELRNWAAGTYTRNQKAVIAGGVLMRVKPSVASTTQDPSDPTQTHWEMVGGARLGTAGGAATFESVEKLKPFVGYLQRTFTENHPTNGWRRSKPFSVKAGDIIDVRLFGDASNPALYLINDKGVVTNLLPFGSNQVSPLISSYTVEASGTVIANNRTAQGGTDYYVHHYTAPASKTDLDKLAAKGYETEVYTGLDTSYFNYVLGGREIGQTWQGATVAGAYGGIAVNVLAGEEWELRSLAIPAVNNTPKYILIDQNSVIVDYLFNEASNIDNPITIKVLVDGVLMVNTRTGNSAASSLNLVKRVALQQIISKDIAVTKELSTKIALKGLYQIPMPAIAFTLGTYWDFTGLGVGDKAPTARTSTAPNNTIRSGLEMVKAGNVVELRSPAPPYATYAVTDLQGNILEVKWRGGTNDSYVIEFKQDGYLYFNYVSAQHLQLRFFYREWTSEKQYKVLIFQNSYVGLPLQYLNAMAEADPVLRLNKKTSCVYSFTATGAPLELWIEDFRQAKTIPWARYYGSYTFPSEGTVPFRVSYDWDVITIQQQSAHALNKELIDAHLPIWVQYVKKFCSNKNVKLYWHLVQSVPAIGGDGSPSGFDKWEKLVEMAEYIKSTYGFELIIPLGTAIENLRQTPYIGTDNGTYDGSHLSSGAAAYVGCCAWFNALFTERFNVRALGNSYLPPAPSPTSYPGAVAVTEANKRVIQMCAEAANQSHKTIADWVVEEVEDYGI